MRSQARRYQQCVKAFAKGMAMGLWIKPQEGACQRCLDASTITYDAETLPELPLKGCEGDHDGYCNCDYRIVRSRAFVEQVGFPVIVKPRMNFPLTRSR